MLCTKHILGRKDHLKSVICGPKKRNVQRKGYCTRTLLYNCIHVYAYVYVIMYDSRRYMVKGCACSNQ